MKLSFFSPYLYIVIILLITSGFISPLRASAASVNDILIDVVPQNPAPNENTSITLNSYAYNLDTVFISWSINGKNVSSGVGKKTLLLNAPDAGSQTNVVAAITLPDGVLNVPLVIRPNVMVLLWQANDSYVPPFYRGKALPSPESEVKVVAMPEIKGVSPKNMTYDWKKDDTNNVDGSGYGKRFFIFTNDYLDDSNNISVTASTTDQKYSSSAGVDIKTALPKIVFYKNDINLGTLWEQSLKDGHKIIGDEIIEAAPYFISPKNTENPALSWNWSINDASVDITGLSKNLLPLKTQQGVSGTSKIKLEINNIYKIFVTASKEISVEF